MEEIHRGASIATTQHWGWIYNWPVPWSMMAFLLLNLTRQLNGADVNRAWAQIDVCFQKYTGPDAKASNLPAWRAIEQLCDRAMYCHPDRMHSGAAYARRVPQDQITTLQPVDPSLSTSNLQDPLFGDVDMLSALPDPDFAMEHLFGPVSTGVNVPDAVANQMIFSDWNAHPPRVTTTPFLQP